MFVNLIILQKNLIFLSVWRFFSKLYICSKMSKIFIYTIYPLGLTTPLCDAKKTSHAAIKSKYIFMSLYPL